MEGFLNFLLMIYTSSYLIASITDARSGYVYNLNTGLMLLLSLALGYKNILKIEVILMISLIILILIFDKDEKYMGRGDMPIIVSSSIILGEQSFVFLTLSSILALFFSLKNKINYIRFVPFLFISFVSTYWFQCH